MEKHHKIDYVELASNDLNATKQFYENLFGWTFTMWGEEYMDCSDGGIMIGFYKSNLKSESQLGGALVTFYSKNLEKTLEEVEKLGGKVIKPIFSFPGGRRFQFTEPSGNEFAVWSKK